MRSQEALWACAEGTVETTANVDMNRAATSTTVVASFLLKVPPPFCGLTIVRLDCSRAQHKADRVRGVAMCIPGLAARKVRGGRRRGNIKEDARIGKSPRMCGRFAYHPTAAIRASKAELRR